MYSACRRFAVANRALRRAAPDVPPAPRFCEASAVITYLDPRSAPSAPIDPYVVSRKPLADGEPLRIGLMANGFPDSVAFLERVRDSLTHHTPDGTVIVLHNKGNASAVATPAQIDALANDAHVVVTAYGH